MSNDKRKVSGVTYNPQASDYYEKRQLKEQLEFGAFGV